MYFTSQMIYKNQPMTAKTDSHRATIGRYEFLQGQGFVSLQLAGCEEF